MDGYRVLQRFHVHSTDDFRHFTGSLLAEEGRWEGEASGGEWCCSDLSGLRFDQTILHVYF